MLFEVSMFAMESPRMLSIGGSLAIVLQGRVINLFNKQVTILLRRMV